MRQFNPESREYKFEEKFVAGLVLSGSDVKTLRLQNIPWAGAKIEIENGVPTLQNMSIPRYKFASESAIDTTGKRKLLLSKKEIIKLITYRKQKYMIIPITIFTKGRWFKLEFGVGRKMNKYDKRQKLKDKEIKQNKITSI